MAIQVREFLDNVERVLNKPARDRARILSVEETKALRYYDFFLTEEALQFIKRSTSPPVKLWIISIVGRQIAQTNSASKRASALDLFIALLKMAIQDLPASLALAQEIIIHSTRLLNSSFQLILNHQPSPLDDLWRRQSQLDQQIIKIKDSPSSTLRNHALKYIERLIFCFSYGEGQQTPSGKSFSLSVFTQPLPPPFSIKELSQQGKQLLDESIATLQKLAGNMKTEPERSYVPNQVVIINSLCIIQTNRSKQFSQQIISALCQVTYLASHSRVLLYALRHALVSIMQTNKWDPINGNDLLAGLTRLGSKDKAESLYKQLRPLEFRDLKRRNQSISLEANTPTPTPVAPTPAPPSANANQILLANSVVSILEKLQAPSTFVPPAHKPLDLLQTQRIFKELETISGHFAQMKPSISSVAETNRARDPRARNAPEPVQPAPSAMETNAPILLEAAKKIGLAENLTSASVVPKSKEETEKQRNKAIERILTQELGAKRCGKDPLRRRLVTRLVCLQKDLEHPLVQSIIKFLMDQFPTRIDLAIQWLYQEYYQCLLEGLPASNERTGESWEKSREYVIAETSRYFRLLQMIMERLCIALQPSKESDPLFRSFILQVPDLSSHTIQTLRTFCDSDEVERISLGLTSFREIVLHRPASCDNALHILLQYCVFPSVDITRLNAIHIILDSIYPIARLRKAVVRYSSECVTSLHLVEEMLIESAPITALPVGTLGEEDEDVAMEENEKEVSMAEGDDDMSANADADAVVTKEKEEGKKENQDLPMKALTSKQVKQKLQLFLKLCRLDIELLHTLFGVYGKVLSDIQEIIDQETRELFANVEQSNPIVRALLSSCPDHAEPLLLHMLQHMLRDHAIEKSLTLLIQELYEQGTLDARFLTPTLHVLDKETVLNYLPALISITALTDVRKAMYSILSSQTEVALTSTELLVHLHTIDITKHNIELKKQAEAIRVCLVLPIYDKKNLGVVLQQLIDISPIPRILLKTIMDAYKKHRELAEFIIDLLHTLIKKQVWKDTNNWKGFIKCCELTSPNSFPVLLQLLPNELTDILSSFKETTRTNFIDYCKNRLDTLPKQLLSVVNSFQ